MTLPNVTIIIPVKPEGAVRALVPLKEVDYPSAFQVLVAYGRRPSAQRNRAAAAASGDILYFLDDDSLVPVDLLRRVAGHFADPNVAVVGGPSLTPPGDSLKQKAFGAALSSPIGGGGMRNRYRKTGGPRTVGDSELILCNLAFRREVFLAAGGLDERLYPNEENELLDRLRSRGFTFIHDPDLAVMRSQRPTFRAFFRQLFSYGRGRAEQTLISGRWRMVTFVPSAFLLYLVLLPFLDNPVYYVPLLCYAMAVILFAPLDAARLKEPLLMPLLVLVFPSLHLAYGAGLLWGLARPRFRRGTASDAGVVVRNVTPGPS